MTLSGIRNRASPSVGGTGMARGGPEGGVTLGGIRSRARPAVGVVGRARGVPGSRADL